MLSVNASLLVCKALTNVVLIVTLNTIKSSVVFVPSIINTVYT